MKDPGALQQVYADLADRFARQGQLRNRDHCLVLAAAAALAAGRADEAERLRQRLLHANPYHLLRPYTSLQEALQIKDIREYVEDLRRQWPPDAARKLHGQAELPAPATRVEPQPVFKTDDTHAPRKSQVDAKATQPAPMMTAEPPRPAPVARKSAPVIAMSPATSPYEPPPRPAPAASPTEAATPLSQWAATMLFFLVVALSAGAAFVTFAWPLME